jgi:hypothetical protein
VYRLFEREGRDAGGCKAPKGSAVGPQQSEAVRLGRCGRKRRDPSTDLALSAPHGQSDRIGRHGHASGQNFPVRLRKTEVLVRQIVPSSCLSWFIMLIFHHKSLKIVHIVIQVSHVRKTYHIHYYDLYDNYHINDNNI